jgi:luciferase family oxidoreductase group 1
MLPHYSAFKIAEQFRVLACLYPGRIDLGVGRAPGGTPASTIALKRSRREMRPDDFPEQLVELLGWLEDGFGDPHPFRQLEATPVPIVAPEPWLLSSSGYGADAAAQLGVGLCFAHFINPVDAASSLRRYRASYVPSARHPKPSAALAVSVICAPTDEAAEELAMPLALWRLRLRTGDPGPVPSLAEALAFSPSPDEELMLDAARSRVVVGAPDRVVAMLEELADTCGVDEVLAVTIAHDHSARLRSYELLGEAAGITPAEHAEHPSDAEHPGIGAAAAASLPQMARARLAR